ncbi:MAG: hypothetical protein LBP33_04635 [Candidatus Adiutrix sp.]|jgi:putative RNA 2'-phosphotransferase|nr:hypothetical protein [Candidatus Adiutrix sp.]
MDKKTIHRQDSLEKLLRYVLGRRPDEFGLCPDADGFVPVKALLAALHDEDDWRGVREGQILMLANQPGDRSAFEIRAAAVRLKPPWASLPPEAPEPGAWPKLLYLALKPAAWPVIFERGLFPKTGESRVLLWADRELAGKVGRRLSPTPVLVTVRARAAALAGAVFKPYSELLYLTEAVPADFLSGPPLPPKEEEAPSRRPREKVSGAAGSFHLPTPEPEVHRGKKKGKHGDAPDWKNQIRRDRRRRGPED